MEMRNKTFDIILALGIIFVVMGHNYQPAVLMLPAYTFQVAIFFFVSGYFFKILPKAKEKILWLKKKFLNLLLPYFILNFFFAIVTHFLLLKGFNFGDEPSFYNFFVVPFIHGQQYSLFIAAWFVPQLFLVHFIAQAFLWKENKIHILIFLITALLFSGYFINNFQFVGGSQLFLVFGRLAFGLSFYLFGYFFNKLEKYLKVWLVRPESFFVICSLYVLLKAWFGNFSYYLVIGKFVNGPIITFLGTICAILMIYIISDYVASKIKDNNIFLKIGRSTFVIMSFHLTVFFLINYVFYKTGFINRLNLSDNIFYNYQAEKYWFIYFFLGISLPIVFLSLFKRVNLKIRSFN